MQQVFLDNEKETLNQIKANYADALEEIENRIAILQARDDADLQHVIYQVEYQKALKVQVQTVLEQLQNNNFETVSDYLTKSYEDGFIGTMYDLQGQGIPLVCPIDQKQVVEALQHETKLSEGLYAALGKDTKRLSKQISGEISRGISNAAMFSEISRNIAGYCGISKNNAMRIARTEAHRIQCKATVDAQWKAKAKGADVVKQWDASLDGRTRDAHREADGQIRELDEDFEVGGERMQAPGIGGSAANVCNCRCALLQRARWALGQEELGTLKERAKFFGLDKTKDFEDYKQKYLKLPKNADTIDVKEYDVLSKTQKLKSAMSSSDYDEYMRVLSEHGNTSLQKLYVGYADEIAGVQYKKDDGYYSPAENKLVFSYPLQKYIDNGISKYHTLAHEYGHFFDAKGEFDGLHYKEVDTIHSKTKYQVHRFKKIPSSSDEFLSAVRKDRETLRTILTTDVEEDLRGHDASCGVQDAIDGLLGHRINWGHGDTYYNRRYSSVKKTKEHKGLQSAYTELGIDASNLGKVAKECRVYEAASEMWANIMSAEVNGGEELEYIKKYLPNSYEALLQILKGVR